MQCINPLQLSVPFGENPVLKETFLHVVQYKCNKTVLQKITVKKGDTFHIYVIISVMHCYYSMQHYNAYMVFKSNIYVFFPYFLFVFLKANVIYLKGEMTY